MPYFDTFDLETIDILLISQYVHLFPLSYGASAMKTIKIGMLGLFVGTKIEHRPARSSRDCSHYRRVHLAVLGATISQPICTIRADRQYNFDHHFTVLML